MTATPGSSFALTSPSVPRKRCVTISPLREIKPGEDGIPHEVGAPRRDGYASGPVLAHGGLAVRQAPTRSSSRGSEERRPGRRPLLGRRQRGQHLPRAAWVGSSTVPAMRSVRPKRPKRLALAELAELAESNEADKDENARAPKGAFRVHGRAGGRRGNRRGVSRRRTDNATDTPAPKSERRSRGPLTSA
jgi:hypothetical protein